MKPTAKIPVSWSEDDLKFIRDNYYIKTWIELFECVKALNCTATMQALRHQCRRMKLYKQIQIRWSKEDVQYLIDNYQAKGDKELAIELNRLKRSFRIIDGKPVYRKFTRKHIDKKKDLLGLKRSREEHIYVRKRNINTGLTYSWNKKDNVYTLGIRSICPEGTIRTWKHYGRMLMHIKVNGRFKHLHRHLWEQKNGQVEKGFNIVFKDGNTMNCELSNLECISDKEIQLRNSGTIGLADRFVAYCLLGKQSKRDERNEVIKDYPELVELKRNQLLLTRKIKEHGSK